MIGGGFLIRLCCGLCVWVLVGRCLLVRFVWLLCGLLLLLGRFGYCGLGGHVYGWVGCVFLGLVM